MSESAHTPGPWRWELNEKSKQLQLCGGESPFDLTVIDFDRWGMNGAVARFRADVRGMNIMHHARDFAVIAPGREHHADWFKLLSHPDADLIAASPDLLTFAGPALDVLEELMAERHGGATTDAQRSALAELQRRIDLGRAAIAKARGGR